VKSYSFSGTEEKSMPFFDQVKETAPRERLRKLQFDKLQRLLREISKQLELEEDGANSGEKWVTVGKG